MSIEFDKHEIAYILESVKGYSCEFGIEEPEQIKKFKAYQSIVNKILEKYEKRELYSLLDE